MSDSFPTTVRFRKCVGISFLRDLFELFVSHYYYHRFHSGGFEKARELSIEKYFQYALVENNYPHYRNWHANLITGMHGWDASTKLENVSRQMQQQQLLMISTSQFDLACVLIGKMFQKTFAACWFMRRNVSKKDPSISDDLRSRFSEYASGDYLLLEQPRLQTDALVQENLPDETSRQSPIKELHNRSRGRCLTNAPQAAIRRSLQYLAAKI